MCYDPRKMGIKQISKPEQMLIASSLADVHDIADRIGHSDFIC